MKNKELAPSQQKTLIATLQQRFEKNTHRHIGIEWSGVQAKLETNPAKMWTLNEMEQTGGEPDVIGYDQQTHEYIFCDCATESPKGRRSLCYDREALDARKEFKPVNSAIDMAAEIGIEILTETEYRALQQLEKFDMKTSSWIQTPSEIRKLDGAIFADFRYNTVFVYHNSAPSYYAARGFRGSLRV